MEINLHRIRTEPVKCGRGVHSVDTHLSALRLLTIFPPHAVVKMLMYYYRDKLNNIETTADFVLIMLLYLNSATEHTKKGFIDVSSISTTDKFNLLNTTIDKRKKVGAGKAS